MSANDSKSEAKVSQEMMQLEAGPGDAQAGNDSLRACVESVNGDDCAEDVRQGEDKESPKIEACSDKDDKKKSECKTVEDIDTITLGNVDVIEVKTGETDAKGEKQQAQHGEHHGAELPKKMSVRMWLIIAELWLLVMCVVFVETMIIPALPIIQLSFPNEIDWIPWVLSAYNIVGAVSTSLSGAMADKYGAKWIAVLDIGIYMIGLVVAAVGDKNIFVLIAGRTLQGFGMAIVILALTIIRTSMPERMLMPLTGIVMGTFMGGMSFGIVFGAWALESIEWHIMFWIAIPFVSVGIIPLIFTMKGPLPFVGMFRHRNAETNVESGPSSPQQQQQSAAEEPKKGTDWLGAALLTISVVTFLMGLTFSTTSGWRVAKTLVPLLIGLVALPALLFWEYKAKNPLLPVRYLARYDQLTLCTISLFTGILQWGLFETLPYMYTSPTMNYQYTRMLSVGLMMLPFGLGTLFSLPVAIAMGRYTGNSLAVMSANIATIVGTALLIWYHKTVAQSIVLVTMAGGGSGMASVALMSLLGVITSAEKYGAVSGANMLLRLVGGALGPVVIDLIMKKNTVEMMGREFFTETAFKHGYIFLTAIFAVALGVSLALPELFIVFTRKGRATLSARGWNMPAGH